MSVTASAPVVEAARTAPPPGSAGMSVRVATAHESLAERYPGLMSLLQRRVGDRQLALDLLQDAVVTTLTKLDGGADVSSEVVAGYVFRTAMNHLRNHRRHERLLAPVDPVDVDAALSGTAIDEPTAIDEIQAESNRELVRRVLRELPNERDREVLVRFYLDEHEKDAICADLGITSVHFNAVVSRARERLRRGLEKIGFARWDLLALPLALLLTPFCR
jgi:RNA polymerase sigma-70 factor (ECF subfamily)